MQASCDAEIIDSIVDARGDAHDTRLDPDQEKILPLLPLKNPATLTPERARAELVALAESRKDVPLPELAIAKDITVDGAAGPIAARLFATGRMPAPTIVYFHGGGWSRAVSSPTSAKRAPWQSRRTQRS
jgi:acetyl esterase/lipase